jgi:hypothetical protein
MKWWLLLVLGVLCTDYECFSRVRIWIQDGNSRLYLTLNTQLRIMGLIRVKSELGWSAFRIMVQGSILECGCNDSRVRPWHECNSWCHCWNPWHQSPRDFCKIPGLIWETGLGAMAMGAPWTLVAPIRLPMTKSCGAGRPKVLLRVCPIPFLEL